MQVKRLPLSDARGYLLVHNVVDADGRRLLRKGVELDDEALQRLSALGWAQVEVAVSAPDDVWEDEAAKELAETLETPELVISTGVGGRVNFQTAVHGVLYIDEARLFALNALQGIALGTRVQHATVHPQRGENRIATLKIIPYALPRDVLDRALALLRGQPPLLDVHPLAPQRYGLLIVGDPAAHLRLQRQFEPPTRERLLRLNSVLDLIDCVEQDESRLTQQVLKMLPDVDGLIVAGQTSIMDRDDLPLRALRCAGAEITAHGAPVDPGNLLALAYRGQKPILCAPGCARSIARNVMDLVLPRLLTGDRLTQLDIARMSLGGLLV